MKDNVTAEDWRKTVEKVVPAVVELHITACRAFDTEYADASQATGFVVDKRHGIILTNRHVVSPGPVVAEAVFVNREEIPVYPIYRDPVHDFGFFRFDPAAIKYLSYEEIPLAPEAASVGLEIRVIGNDSGEKMSILSGTLARLDREAPQYAEDGYNDFNTFYLQAASGTKGGSSGSPVIDCQGRAVALNAGGMTSSASAFYFPLERVVRALKFLQTGVDCCQNKWEAVTIPRGTLQATFIHKGFDEIRRLGLRSETEQLVRHASPLSETGMLVVDSVVPGGPAYKSLVPGDVLVRMNGEVITHFLKMETLLDDGVGQNVELDFERGGIPLTVQLVVQDLHSITPNFFLEVSGAVIHPLSYQQARNFHFPCGLVYVSEPGCMLNRAGVPQHAIIKKLAGEDISHLEDFINALSKLSRGARVPLEYITHEDRHRQKSVLVALDRHEWYASPQIYTRDDTSGIWIGKQALPPNSQLISSFGIKQGLTSNRDVENFPVEPVHQDVIVQLANRIARMDTSSFEHVTDGPHAHLEYDNGTNTRRVGEDLSAELDDLISSGDTAVRGYRDSSAKSGNASFAERVIEPTLLRLKVYIPLSCILDGVQSRRSSGTGVIIYQSEEMGLVAVDKHTVAISACEVMLSFAALPIEIPGEVVFMHPVHNYAIIAYDPTALGPTGASVVRAAELLPEPAVGRGETVYLVGLSSSLRATSRKSVVTNPYAALKLSSSDSPRYRATNMEFIELDTDFGSNFTGVLTDEHGRVKAIWGSFSTWVSSLYSFFSQCRVYLKLITKSCSQQKSRSNQYKDHQFVKGIPVNSLSQVLKEIISGAKGPPLLINGVRKAMPLLRILEVELYPTLLSEARSFGLSNNWIQALVKKDPVRRQVLQVQCCLAGSKAENVLEQGDMVLAINKKPVTCFKDVDNACHALDDIDDLLKLTIWRQGRELELLVGTDIRDGNGTTRAINWSGCLVQYPHPEVRALGFLPEEGHGVYVTEWCDGSPMERYDLDLDQWIVEVNGQPTKDLDAFINVIKEIEDEEFARVKTVKLDGETQVLTMKQNLYYWPTWELRDTISLKAVIQKLVNVISWAMNAISFGRYLSENDNILQSKRTLNEAEATKHCITIKKNVWVLKTKPNIKGSTKSNTKMGFRVKTAEEWRKALEKAVPAVVVLRTTVTRSFDTEFACVRSETGFVVDKRRGIILTNRNVVNPGPVVAEAVFMNDEEVPVYPIYRDPVSCLLFEPTLEM
ncbi:protease Do-like 7 [Artemisia annua]|uniref:Protease Do-like 7 n=1 Tax=Artemisia annua TaxID=35608 RepID=A0A2U1QNV7_ARTAN|nr:protease Do-like 7 [Artemisia annua]